MCGANNGGEHECPDLIQLGFIQIEIRSRAYEFGSQFNVGLNGAGRRSRYIDCAIQFVRTRMHSHT